MESSGGGINKLIGGARYYCPGTSLLSLSLSLRLEQIARTSVPVEKRGNGNAAAAATVYLTKGFTSDDRIRGTVGRGPGWPNIRRLVFTPQVFMGHDPPTRRARSRFRNSEHPRREWIEREREESGSLLYRF